MQANTQTVSINTTPARLFEFLADPANMPAWASGFCKAIRQENDKWLVTTPHGEMKVCYALNSALGTIDFHMYPTPDTNGVAYSRVLAHGDGAEYIFTQFQAPSMPDEVFAQQIALLQEELIELKKLFER